jgi:tetratricopeptide (TPR) repeat protein
MANVTFANLLVFEEEYTYQASEYDSKVSSRALALEQVKRLLLEKLGTYLESETEVKNFQLTKDQIVILTAGIVSAEVIDEKWDGKTYYLKSKITADPKVVANSIDKLRQDRQNMKDLKETRKKADEALSEVEKLKKELGSKKSALYDKTIKELIALDWFEKGMNYAMDSSVFSEKENRYVFVKDFYFKAIKAFTQAILLNPTFGRAYEKRGNLYHSRGKYDEAISDFNKAIHFGQNNTCIYIMRGSSYYAKKRYYDAINDLSKAIEIDPAPLNYNTRGIMYEQIGQFDKAAADFEKAGGIYCVNCPQKKFMVDGCSVEAE